MIKSGDIITVTAEVFDALLRAGMLAQWDTVTHGEASWPVFGETNDDGSVTCKLEIK